MNRHLAAQLTRFLSQILTCALLIAHSPAAEGAVSSSPAVVMVPSRSHATATTCLRSCLEIEIGPITTRR